MNKKFLSSILLVILISFILFIFACAKKSKLDETATDIVDTTAPVISNVQTTGVTETEATITWTTDEVATSQVQYGLTSNYTVQTTEDTNKVISHSVGLSSLTAQTTYHYCVKSKDTSGNSSASSDYTFFTKDLTAPTINYLTTATITATGATITWTTNEPATSQVEYGTTTSYGSSTTEDTTLVYNHSVTLSGLSINTNYNYRAKSKDASGNLANSSNYAFSTDITAPVISNVASSNVTSTSATITWNTDETSTSQVLYGPTDSYGSQTSIDTTKVTSHTINLTGLTGYTTYHYQAKSMDAAGNVGTSSDKTFTTPLVIFYFDDIQYTDGTNTVIVYDDAVKLGQANGFMGASNGISLSWNSIYTTNPHSGLNCVRVTYDPTKEEHAGIYITANGSMTGSPTTALAGLNQSSAQLSFWVRAEYDITMKEMGMGVNTYDPCGQNQVLPQYQKLTTTWQQFTVDLAGKDLSSVIGIFYFYIDSLYKQ